MKKAIFILSILATTLFSEEVENSVDCLILEDENSIICKYIQKRVTYDKNVTFNWIDPNDELSRSRELTIKAGHGSIYDFRYIKGRIKGEWKLQVVDDSKKFETSFEIK